ncbi:MAG: 1,4-beta-xylanase [Armatimonadia bacterium]|nr:1,4-beta-xylanase [Armatimonadia bacterium]
MKPCHALCLIPLLGLSGPSEAQPLDREQVLDGAEERIERHRMSDAVVEVVDAEGEPVAGAQVRVRMTRHQFLFGCNLFAWDAQPNAADQQTYRERFADLLNYATLPFYWWSYDKEPRYERIAAMAQWCGERGIATKGHPLVWNYAAPPWLPEDTDTILALSDARVVDCVERFRGTIDRWDVVNEATDPFRFENPMTDAWRAAGRVEYTKHAFELARQASPTATLLINDYRRGEEYAQLCDELRDEDGELLYDAIGIQSHQHWGVIPPEDVWAVCERFAGFGVPLHWTENTIVSGTQADDEWSGSTPEGEARQADQVETFYTIIFSHPANVALTWWDLSDRHAWMGAPSGLLREDLTPKPAYDRLMELIKGEWWTEEDLTTAADGTASFRGFHGEYTITAVVDGEEYAVDAALIPGEEPSLQIVLR